MIDVTIGVFLLAATIVIMLAVTMASDGPTCPMCNERLEPEGGGKLSCPTCTYEVQPYGE